MYTVDGLINLGSKRPEFLESRIGDAVQSQQRAAQSKAARKKNKQKAKEGAPTSENKLLEKKTPEARAAEKEYVFFIAKHLQVDQSNIMKKNNKNICAIYNAN